MAGMTRAGTRWRGPRAAMLASLAWTSVAGASSVSAEPVVELGSVSVVPRTELVDGSVVDVSVEGATPGIMVTVSLCEAGSDHDVGCGPYGSVDLVDDDGSVRISVEVNPILRGPEGTTTDCRQVACELGVSGWDLDSDTVVTTRVPLAFDPDAPLLPPPVVTIAPSSGLVDRHLVTVRGSGFEPHEWIDVTQCRDGGVCRWLAELRVEDDGTLDTVVAVRARIPQYDEPVWDCRSTTSTCELRVRTDRHTLSFDLEFDPTAPLAPPPEVTVDPRTGLSDGQTVTIEGTGFSPGGDVDVSICRTATDECDIAWGSWAVIDTSGSFALAQEVYADLVVFDGFVDCRVDPGCEIRVRDSTEDETVTVPISFRPAGPRARYIDPVFSEVTATRDITYRSTIDAAGDPVDLRMDIYAPAGDTVKSRPAIVWLFGGWFMFGDKEQLADYARDAARRGYVGVTIDYRTRPGMPLDELQSAAADAYDDALAAIAWLRANAAAHGIDPDTIISAGYSAGAVVAWNLAYLPPDRGPTTSPVAGSVAIAGLPFAGPSAGDPPVLGIHAADDAVVPIGSARDQCASAAAAGAVCEWVEYPTGGHYVVVDRARDIVSHTYDFLRRHVLEPRGYVVAPPPGPPPPPPGPPVRPEVPVRPSPSSTSSTTLPAVTVPVPTSDPPSSSHATSTTKPAPAPIAGPTVAAPTTGRPAPPGRPIGPIVVAGAAAAEPVMSQPSFTG